MKPISILPLAVLLMGVGCKQKPDYDATGIFEATTVTVSAETPGKILWLAPVEGDTVVAGETLGQIDTTTLVLQQKQIARQQAALQSNTPDTRAQGGPLRSQIEHARVNVERIEALYAQGAATQQQRDDARAQLRTLENQLQGLLSTLGNSRSNITDNAGAMQYQREQVEVQIAKSRITSPLTGTILAKMAQPGEFATAGKPLYRIANLNEMYLRAYFTVRQLADLKLGDKVTVIADYGDNVTRQYPGTVSWIAQESEFTPKSIQTPDSRANLVYAVKIAVKNDGNIKLGQYGEVRLK